MRYFIVLFVFNVFFGAAQAADSYEKYSASLQPEQPKVLRIGTGRSHKPTTCGGFTPQFQGSSFTIDILDHNSDYKIENPHCVGDIFDSNLWKIFPDNSVDKIILEHVPFIGFESGIKFIDRYNTVFNQVNRVLKDNGILEIYPSFPVHDFFDVVMKYFSHAASIQGFINMVSLANPAGQSEDPEDLLRNAQVDIDIQFYHYANETYPRSNPELIAIFTELVTKYNQGKFNKTRREFFEKFLKNKKINYAVFIIKKISKLPKKTAEIVMPEIYSGGQKLPEVSNISSLSSQATPSMPSYVAPIEPSISQPALHEPSLQMPVISGGNSLDTLKNGVREACNKEREVRYDSVMCYTDINFWINNISSGFWERDFDKIVVHAAIDNFIAANLHEFHEMANILESISCGTTKIDAALTEKLRTFCRYKSGYVETYVAWLSKPEQIAQQETYRAKTEAKLHEMLPLLRRAYTEALHDPIKKMYASLSSYLTTYVALKMFDGEALENPQFQEDVKKDFPLLGNEEQKLHAKLACAQNRWSLQENPCFSMQENRNKFGRIMILPSQCMKPEGQEFNQASFEAYLREQIITYAKNIYKLDRHDKTAQKIIEIFRACLISL